MFGTAWLDCDGLLVVENSSIPVGSYYHINNLHQICIPCDIEDYISPYLEKDNRKGYHRFRRFANKMSALAKQAARAGFQPTSSLQPSNTKSSSSPPCCCCVATTSRDHAFPPFPPQIAAYRQMLHILPRERRSCSSSSVAFPATACAVNK